MYIEQGGGVLLVIFEEENRAEQDGDGPKGHVAGGEHQEVDEGLQVAVADAVVDEVAVVVHLAG